MRTLNFFSFLFLCWIPFTGSGQAQALLTETIDGLCTWEEKENGQLSAWVGVGSFFSGGKRSELIFGQAAAEVSLFNYGHLEVNLGNLYAKWKAGGSAGKDVEELGNRRIRLLAPGASLKNIKFQDGEIYAIELIFTPFEPSAAPVEGELNLNQISQKNGRLLGAQRFMFLTQASRQLAGFQSR